MPRRFFATFAAAALLAGCADAGQPAANEPRQVARFVIVSGNDQVGPPGEELPQPLAARAEDANGNPVPGRHVAFRVTDGGGSMYVGGGVTDADGIVKDYWTLGTVAGSTQRVEARTVVSATGEKQVLGTFNAQALAQVATPARLVHYPAPYATQNGLVGRVQPIPFKVVVTDRFGNVIRREGITVHWTASGNGRVNLTPTVTDSTGVTGVRWYFATVPGPQTLTASMGGSTQPATFLGNAGPGPVVSLVIHPSDSLHFTATGDTARLSATAVDSYGNPWPVSWTLPSTSVATFSGSPPKVTAGGNGKVYFIASAGSQADTGVVVVQRLVSTIIWRQTFPTTLSQGSYVQLNSHVLARDANGHNLDATFTFTMSDPSMGTINSNGLFRPSKAGTVQFTATSGGVSSVSPVLTVQ